MESSLFQQAQETFIAEEAAKLFFAKSINEVTFKDLALHLGIGEATLYRRYTNKYNLVLSVAAVLQKKVFSQFFPDVKAATGYRQLETFYLTFLKIFDEEPGYYKFIGEFDAYIINNSRDNLANYEEGINVFKKAFDEAYALGLKDGTVKEIEDVDCFYFSTTHALLGLCKKLASQNVLIQDYRLDKSKEVKVLIDTILLRIREN